MTATVMDGEALAVRIKEDLAVRIAALSERGITPGLGTVLVGDDGPSHKYVSMKHADCAALGISSIDVRLPADATQSQVLDAIAALNADPAVDAFILQFVLSQLLANQITEGFGAVQVVFLLDEFIERVGQAVFDRNG